MYENKLNALRLLWLIREHGPISRRELFDHLHNTESASKGHLRNFIYTLMSPGTDQPPPAVLINRYIDGILDTLIRAGLVERKKQNGLKFRLTTQYDYIVQLFGISLTAYLQVETGAVITATPLWGEPLLKKQLQPTHVFVAMPFSENLKPIYQGHIQPVVEKLNLSVKRGDDFFSGKQIMDEVWSAIFYSKLCIVDCTSRNANVFYELGIAHTLGRKTILIAQSMEDIPFDIQHRRVIVYEPTPLGMKDFEERLRKTIISELELQDIEE